MAAALTSGLDALQGFIDQRSAMLRQRRAERQAEYRNRKIAVANNGPVPLAYAYSDDQVLAQLLSGVDINAQDSGGYTALMSASGIGDPWNVRLLLRHGADTEIENTQGGTALFSAVDRGWLQVVLLLLAAGANPNHVPYFLSEPLLKEAEEGGYHDIIRLLQYLKKPDADFAARLGRLQADTVQAEALNRAALHDDEEEVASLLGAGVSPDAADEFSFTSLQNAVLRGRLEAVRRLLAAGADPNAVNAFDQTALMLAARKARFLKEKEPEEAASAPARQIIDLLLGAKADRSRRDFAGLVARDYFLKKHSYDDGDVNRKPSAKQISELLSPR